MPGHHPPQWPQFDVPLSKLRRNPPSNSVVVVIGHFSVQCARIIDKIKDAMPKNRPEKGNGVFVLYWLVSHWSQFGDEVKIKKEKSRVRIIIPSCVLDHAMFRLSEHEYNALNQWTSMLNWLSLNARGN